MVMFASVKSKLLIGIFIFTGMAIWLSHHAGQKVADAQLERLIAVWPDVVNMSQKERGMLNTLVWVCKLDNSEQSTAAVLDCLQSAAENDDLTLPTSMTRERLFRRFQELQMANRPHLEVEPQTADISGGRADDHPASSLTRSAR